MPHNTDCDPLGCVGSPAMQKPHQSNSFRLRSVCRRGAMRSWKCRFWMCANECVWTSVKLRSHGLKFKENGPLDPLWALQCRKLGVDIFFCSSWGSNTSLLENVWERRAWPTLINLTCSKKDTHASSCECPPITQTHLSSNTSPNNSNTQCPFESSSIN